MKKHKIKKSLARCLTILLIFSLFVPVLSAFSSAPSFAEETSAPSSPSCDDVKSYTKIENLSVTFNEGCPFWDGNLNLPDNSEYGGKLFSDKTKSWIYVNGKLATFAPAHTGPNSKGGVYFAILGVNGVNIESGTSVTITVATQTASGNYYGEATTTAPSNLIGYDSSYVKLMGTRSATITVRGKDIASKYSVNEKVNVRFHDDHDINREFTVNSNDGNEVVFGCSDFTPTSNTIAEVGYGTERGFAALVDENIQANQLSATDSNKVNGYYQTAPGTTNGNNMRFLFTADDETLSAGEEDGTALFQTGTAIISFMKGDSKVRSLEMGLSEFTYFRSVFADGDLYEAEDGEAVFGIVISNVPVFAWTDIKIEILSSDGSIKYSGTASKSIAEAVAMGGYVWLDGLDGEKNIQAFGGTAEAPVSGNTINRPGNAEGVNNLFNKNAAKFGAGDKEGNKGKITVTWNYDDAKTVSLYAIYTGNDSRGNNYNRNPLSWVLYGSNDDNDEKEYVVIDTVDDPALPNEGGQGKYYEVDKPTAYQYYKIEFVTNSGKYFQLGEIKMLETATSSQYSFNDMIAPPAVISSTPEVSSTTEGLAQLFDGNPNTKLGYYSAVSKFEIFWSYGEAVKVTGYSLTTGNDSTVFTRNPDSWVLYGSNDGLNYKEIGKGSVSHNFSNEMYIYGIDNPGSYQYYKIEFSVNNHEFQMADIALYN